MVQGTVVLGKKQAEDAREKAVKAAATFQEVYRGIPQHKLPSTRSFCACWTLPTLKSMLPDRPLITIRQEIPKENEPVQSTSKLPEPELPVRPRRIRQKRMTCVCQFPPTFVESFLRATSIADKHGLLDAIGLSKEELDKHVTQPPWLDGAFVATFRGTTADLEGKAIRSLQAPPELFVLATRASMKSQEEEMERLSSFGHVTVHADSYVSSVYALYQSSQSRIRKHVERIFSPGIANIRKIPELYNNGTFIDTYKRAYEAAATGQPFELGQRMLEATSNVVHAAWNRDRSDKGNGPDPPGRGGEGAM